VSRSFLSKFYPSSYPCHAWHNLWTVINEPIAKNCTKILKPNSGGNMCPGLDIRGLVAIRIFLSSSLYRGEGLRELKLSGICEYQPPLHGRNRGVLWRSRQCPRTYIWVARNWFGRGELCGTLNPRKSSARLARKSTRHAGGGRERTLCRQFRTRPSTRRRTCRCWFAAKDSISIKVNLRILLVQEQFVSLELTFIQRRAKNHRNWLKQDHATGTWTKAVT